MKRSQYLDGLHYLDANSLVRRILVSTEKRVNLQTKPGLRKINLVLGILLSEEVVDNSIVYSEQKSSDNGSLPFFSSL